MDIVRAIRRLQNHIATSITFSHVYGHQDNNAPAHTLSCGAQVNIIVDRQAQSHLDECILENKFFTQIIL